ncbi:hypothetical protein E2C01_070431 [Portunus trituberculatus]|uniref:Uncharacterized protein n=1 Tax=Portunus trituberculatus TaxID=210409 RepID=A0A5B7HU47_PORTR|nr:hypothetical protein [Portunus trituberculatus]
MSEDARTSKSSAVKSEASQRRVYNYNRHKVSAASHSWRQHLAPLLLQQVSSAVVSYVSTLPGRRLASLKHGFTGRRMDGVGPPYVCGIRLQVREAALSECGDF